MKIKISPKKAAMLNIIISIIFALAIITVTKLFPESYPNSTYIIIAIWIIPSTLINTMIQK